ncbi:hypothetical protein [Streptomyces violascens]|uniref:hypothetical protein n=1 Tax=Streptomyces violascens TaxID=67381 RepID=UPI0016770177|nr:hypothetical protein [Streptomyces violascens]GGU52640.1 hypothetical protein GCM10010289_85990 [Streptomyces violascens]
MSRYHASPTHILALVKGAAEGDAIKHITPAGLGTHLDDAVACGLLTVGSDDYDLHPTDTGRALYEAHLTGLPDGRANHWGSAVPRAAVDQVHQLHLEATDRAVVVEAELTGPGHGTVTVPHGTRHATPPRATLGRTRNAAGRATGWYIDPAPGGPAPARATGRTKNDAIRAYLRTLGAWPDAVTYARIRYTLPR